MTRDAETQRIVEQSRKLVREVEGVAAELVAHTRLLADLIENMGHTVDERRDHGDDQLR